MPRLEAPANVNATDGDSTVVVTWDAVDGAFSYVVYRSSNESGDGYIIGVTDQLSWDDDGATPGKLYWYKVRARGPLNCGAVSDPDSGYAEWQSEIVEIPDTPVDLDLTVIE